MCSADPSQRGVPHNWAPAHSVRQTLTIFRNLRRYGLLNSLEQSGYCTFIQLRYRKEPYFLATLPIYGIGTVLITKEGYFPKQHQPAGLYGDAVRLLLGKKGTGNNISVNFKLST
jgi:hypothetical protein